MAAPGCTFEPSEQELTDVCLYGKITGAGRDVGAIHVADVYSADPETLAKSFAPAPGTGRGDKEPEWYFFSPVRYASKKKNSGRRARIIGCDSNKKWHSEIGAVPVEGSAVGGHKVNLTYMVRSNASGEKKKHERAGWILAEFGIAPEHGGGQLELCKLHRSPHFQETAAGSKKRKAAAADELYSADRCKNLCLRQEMPQDRPRPEYSAYRESSFGHGILQVKNETHALWQWHRNQDVYNSVGDEIFIVRESHRCLRNCSRPAHHRQP
ncbi:hypothetical protein BRADI_1g01695v3 [Brachypodium distachyon]|uniref:NAC domain-containing protein n=1 Tax=Brachypodium distachyon TaxID=15368 RepID=A0A0Q3RFU4_BRADI|nr:hypothetical protein BRADI_1g01695v3 [Brachypodium distachyon]